LRPNTLENVTFHFEVLIAWWQEIKLHFPETSIKAILFEENWEVSSGENALERLSEERFVWIGSKCESLIGHEKCVCTENPFFKCII